MKLPPSSSAPAVARLVVVSGAGWSAPGTVDVLGHEQRVGDEVARGVGTAGLAQDGQDAVERIQAACRAEDRQVIVDRRGAGADVGHQAEGGGHRSVVDLPVERAVVPDDIVVEPIRLEKAPRLLRIPFGVPDCRTPP